MGACPWLIKEGVARFLVHKGEGRDRKKASVNIKNVMKRQQHSLSGVVYLLHGNVQDFSKENWQEGKFCKLSTEREEKSYCSDHFL